MKERLSGLHRAGAVRRGRTDRDPPAIIDKLNATINRELTSPEMDKTLTNMGAERGAGSPQDFAAMLASDCAHWEALAKAANIRID